MVDSMLASLLFFGAVAVSGIKYAYRNSKDLSKPFSSTNKGEPLYMGLDGRWRSRSEKLVWKSQPDQFGNDHNLLVGERSGKVYEDSHDNQLRYLNIYDEKNKREAIQNNELVYMKHDDRFGKEVPVELKTGEIIAAYYHMGYRDVNSYRKFYLEHDIHKVSDDPRHTPDKYWCLNLPLNYRSDQSKKGDWGIPITQEEYEKLKLHARGASSYPDDNKIREKIGTKEDPYYEQSIKIEEQRKKDIEKKVRKEFEGDTFYCIVTDDEKISRKLKLAPEDYGGNKFLSFRSFYKKFELKDRPDVMLDNNGKFWYYNYALDWVCNKKECDLGVTKDTIDDTVFQLCFKDVTEEYMQIETKCRIAIDD